MAVHQVNSVEALSATLKSAAAGDMIALAPGVYGPITVYGINFASNVTITSADPNSPAVLTGLTVNRSSGIEFNNLEFRSEAEKKFPFQVMNSDRITMADLDIHGSLDDNPHNDTDGLRITDSTNVTVANSEFQQFFNALSIVDNENVNISGNYFHDIRADGIRGGGTSNLTISNNFFTDFYPMGEVGSTGDHADAIQIWTTGTTETAHDITISENVFLRGEGRNIQGIFVTDQIGIPFERVTIVGNYLAGALWNGIMVSGASDVEIANNRVASFTDQMSWIRVENVSGAEVSNNEAAKYVYKEVARLKEVGSEINSAVSDGGRAFLREWSTEKAGRPGTSPTELLNQLQMQSPASPLSVVTTVSYTTAANVVQVVLGGESHISTTGNGNANLLIGNRGNNEISGMDGADTITGGAGNDTLMGGSGDDVLEGGAGNDRIDGGGGIDTVTYSSATSGVKVNIGLTTAQSTGAGVDTLIALENLSGSSFNDTLTGSITANVISGGTGDDVITGGLGGDRLLGDAGADTFVYSSISESTSSAAGRDSILDFSSQQGDRIDLRGIDAINGGANDAFRLVSAFTKQAGQLTANKVGDHYEVRGDVNGDGQADFVINVYSINPLTSSDFLL